MKQHNRQRMLINNLHKSRAACAYKNCHLYRDKCLLLFISLLISLVPVLAQAVVINPEVYDFGKVEDWDNPAAAFIVENRGDKPISFLPNFFHKDCSIDFPKGKILPGHTASFMIYYFPKELGKFHKEIKIYFAEFNEPIEISINGHLVSFAHNALLDCPGNGFHKDEKLGFDQLFTAIDKTTGLPIAGVDIFLSDGDQQLIELKSNEHGKCQTKLIPNKFIISASHPQYYPVDDLKFLNRQSGKYLVKMSPIPVALLSENEQPITSNENDNDNDTAENEMKPAEEDPPKTNPEIIPNKESAMDIAAEESKPILSNKLYRPNHITMLIDVSQSMNEHDKIGQLKQATATLLQSMRDIDYVTVISYAYRVETLVEHNPLGDPEEVLATINAIQAKGKTMGASAIKKAFDTAIQYYEEGRNNQIILCTDGLFSENDISDKELYKLIKSGYDEGIRLSIVGFGKDANAKEKMEKMASLGGGNVLLFEKNNPTNALLLEEIKKQSRVDY